MGARSDDDDGTPGYRRSLTDDERRALTTVYQTGEGALESSNEGMPETGGRGGGGWWYETRGLE